MLVFDLDGTLLDNNGNMPIENINYLYKLKNEGYIIVIATGRTILSVFNKLNNVPCINYIISDTGAKIYDVLNKKVMYSHSIPYNITVNILDLYNDDFKYIDICSNEKYYKYSLFINENNEVVKTYKSKNDLLKEINEVSHIGLNFKNSEHAIKLYNYIISNYKSIDCLIMQDSFNDNKWLELLPKGASKYTAISKLAKYLKIPNDNIMAFGDSLNDIEMLENVGIGVAMENALNEVKEKANYTTSKSNTKLGVIDFLKEYLND